MKVVVGLGNPGSRYAGTRHNVGFDVIDTLARAPGVERFQTKFAAEVAEWRDQGEKTLLVKPQTFMNRSGLCVRQIVDYFQVELGDLLVVVDDMSLTLGKLRFRVKGSHGGHNGLRDIQGHLGTTEYARIRIGVDAPKDADAVDHVLGRFRPAEHAVIEDALLLASQAVMVWIHQGIQECMNRYNADPKEVEKKPRKKKEATPESTGESHEVDASEQD